MAEASCSILLARFATRWRAEGRFPRKALGYRRESALRRAVESSAELHRHEAAVPG
jgi:hypothetical protein